MNNRLAVLAFAIVSTVTVVAQDTPKPPVPSTPKSTAPTLTTDDKLQLREFELKDSQLSSQIISVQNAQKENGDSYIKWARGKCASKDGKTYQIDMNSALCVEVPGKK